MALDGKKTGKGFLILELVLAMLLISIALVGLLDGFSATIKARHTNDLSIRFRYLLEQKIADLDRAGHFAKGAQEGTFPTEPGFTWNTEIAETVVPNLFTIKVTVASNGDALAKTVFLREQATQEAQ